MNQSEQENLANHFRNVFCTGQSGPIVLDLLKIFGRATIQQSCFDSTSERQTCYNLGANSVVRYIETMIAMKSETKSEDCTMELETEREKNG